jgi:hypothetical protein
MTKSVAFTLTLFVVAGFAAPSGKKAPQKAVAIDAPARRVSPRAGEKEAAQKQALPKRKRALTRASAKKVPGKGKPLKRAAPAKTAAKRPVPRHAPPKKMLAKKGPGIFELSSTPVPASPVDRIVFQKLKALKIKPVLCSDAVFVRRAYLDVIGTLPTAEEARAFIEDPDRRNKRAGLIDELMARDEFATYWSMKWGDALRIKAEFPINLWPNAAQAYHRWVEASIVENKPYDRFVRELLTSSGSNFRVGPVNFYRAMQNKTPEGIAVCVALTFMGVRAESWPKGKLDGMTAFFSQVGYKPTSEWKEENVFWDPLGLSKAAGAPGNAKVTTVIPKCTNAVPSLVADLTGAAFPDGTKPRLTGDRDPREVFADWLITPENPWFTRCIVNRVWAWLLGRGIVHEPDDVRKDNPPSNPQLLAFLEKELKTHGYDLKHLYRLILTSNTYQLSSVARSASPKAQANFAAYPLRRLDAEVLIDAVNAITGTTDLYTSPIPEPFTYIPKDRPAISIADGSITSHFLALFGRSARATGMSNERNNNQVASQWLHMLNSGHIQQKIERGPRLKKLFASRKPTGDIAEELYLAILSRFPTAEEMAIIEAYGAAGTRKRSTDWVDIAWSLINSPEFLYRH